MMMPRTGALIVLEGLDAAGKATNALKLKERFKRLRSAVALYSFPRYMTPVGGAILRHLKGEIELMEEETDAESSRSHTSAPEDALAFQCLMVADKYHAATAIQHHLDQGHVVICDRWWQSAYAFGGADGLDKDWLVDVHAALPQPWLNIFIDVPPEEALKRRPDARDRYERDREKQKVVRANYEHLWADAGADYVKIGGVGTPDEVHERIWQALETRP